MKKEIKDEDLPLAWAPPSEKKRRIKKFSQYGFFLAAFFSFMACFSFFRETNQVNYFFLAVGILSVCLGFSITLFKDSKAIMVIIGTLGIATGIAMLFYVLLISITSVVLKCLILPLIGALMYNAW